MKNKYSLIPSAILVLSVLFAGTSCRRQEREKEQDSPIAFSAVRVGFDGTNSTLTEGDSIGIYIGGSVGAANCLLAIDGKGVPHSADEGLFWKNASGDAAVPVFAYLPYKATAGVEKISADINSGLLASFSQVRSGEENIRLEFSSPFSLLRFSITECNDVESISVSGVQAYVSIDPATGAVSPEGGIRAIEAESDGQGIYSVMVAPGNISPSITVNLANGDKVRFGLEDVTLESGKVTDLTGNPLDVEEAVGSRFTIAGLNAMAKSSELSFDEVFGPMTVTCVSGKYAHLEDATGAILVYQDNHGLDEGQVLGGRITGRIKLYQGYPEITMLKIEGADISSTGTLPCTEILLSELLADYDSKLNRRILLRNVTISKGFRTGNSNARTGTLSQGASSIQIYNSSNEAFLATGSTGSLICYPSCYEGRKQLAIYDNDQFSESSGTIEDIALTKITIPGFYDLSDPTSPLPLVVCGNGDQYASTTGAGYRSFRIQNLRKGFLLNAKLIGTATAVGDEYALEIESVGMDSSISGIYSAVFAGRSDGIIWLHDDDAALGVIMTAEQ